MTFTHMAEDLLNSGQQSDQTFTLAPGSLTRKHYEQWKKQYTWHALRGQRYGQSFCNHFGIQDHRIYFERNWLVCDKIIQREWLARS